MKAKNVQADSLERPLEGSPKNKEKKKRKDVLIQKLSGIRLTILLCILLSVVSLIGTLIPQNQPMEHYERSYGSVGARFMETAGLFDVYHSPFFVALLCLLSVNLVVCSWKRFPGIWRVFGTEPSLVPSDLSFKGWKHRDTVVLSASAEELEPRMGDIVSKALGRGAKHKVLDSQREVFYVERKRYARLGPYVTHLGILIILVGGLVGVLFGFRGSLTLAEGNEASSVWVQKKRESMPLGFTIRCNRFTIETYPNGTPREYQSDVSLLATDGSKILGGTVRVNHPLTYKGITFYQSTYGTIPKMTIRVQNTDSGKEAVVETELNQPFLLPGEAGDRAMALAFQEDLHIPPEMVRVTAFSRQHLGPAVQLVILKEKGFGQPFWVLKDFPQMSRGRKGPYDIELKGYKSTTYTGLQVSRDPGASVVWIGCTLLILGFFFSFLVDHEILWVTSERRGPGKVRVHLAGRAVRHPAVYAGRFAKRKASFRKQLSPWIA